VGETKVRGGDDVKKKAKENKKGGTKGGKC